MPDPAVSERSNPLARNPLDTIASAHAVQVTAFTLAWLLRPGTSPGRMEIVVLVAAAVLVCTSRLYLQVHFPCDVVAGALLATFWVVLLRRLPAWQEHKQ